MKTKGFIRKINGLVFMLSFIFMFDTLAYGREKDAGNIKFSSPDQVQITSSVIGLRKCRTATDYMFSNGWCYPMTDKIAYTTDFYLGYGIFINDPQDGERYTWRYYYPNGELYTEQYWEFYIDPVEGCCWRSSLGHLSCGGCAALLMMGFFIQNNPYLKPGLWTVRVYRDISLFGTDNFTIKCGEKLEITSPEQGDDFDLTQNYIATPDIPFMAVFDPSNITEKISWTLNLEYSTSGGRCGCGDQRSFSANPNEPHNESYKSMGGQLIINATGQVSECKVEAEPVMITITGVQIPDALITERLVQLYHGQTHRLMTGLAQIESSYTQFETRSLYNRTDRWPTEGVDGGSHIGLMQVETTMERAWDWEINTRYGVDWFQHEKMGMARQVAGIIRARCREYCQAQGLHCTGPRHLTQTEYENMALVLYGESAGGLNPDLQYYRAQLNPSTLEWEWTINTQNNPLGVAYADRVRASQH